jgi:cytochrome P450
VIRARKSELAQRLPPGPRTPAAIQLLGTWTRPTASLERLRRYGSRVTVKLPFQPPFVILSDPAEIKELFTAPPDAVHPGEGARILEPVVGRYSVILLDEEAHLEQRRLLLPAFHGERMQRLSGLMMKLAEREVGSWPVGEPVSLHGPLQRLTLEVILNAVFGVGSGPEHDRLRDVLGELLAFGENPLSVLPALQRWLRFTRTQRRFESLRAQTDEIIFALVERRRAEAAAGEPAGDDVLAMLLAARHEDGSQMSARELRDELVTALVAGHETTASQLAWALERLAREPAVAARLAAEIDAGEGDEYLTATINEILRLRPVLPNAEPRLTKREVEIGGHRYPRGVVLLASAHLVHHDPAIYEQPWSFRPERFLGNPPGTYTWIPFGGGRRRCLGASFALQEMKIVLRAVLARYELRAPPGPPEAARRRSITFSPARGATVALHERRPVEHSATGARVASLNGPARAGAGV